MIPERSKYVYFLVLCIVTIIYFCTVILNQKNYQDAWILEGLVVPTAIFVFFFLIAETFIQDNKKLVILAAFFLAAINIVPGLKYTLFCGPLDTPAHFRFTNEIISSGYIPGNEYISEQYESNPGMHLLMACISISSGISTNDVFRFIVPALSGLVPFIVYFITKDVLDHTIERYVIIASSFPIVQRYIAYGTSLAILPYFLLMAVFLNRGSGKMKSASFWLIFVILSYNLIISHAITSLFVSFVFVGILFILKFLNIMRKKSLGSFQVSILIMPSLFYLILLAAWWLNTSDFNLNTLVDLTQALLFGRAEEIVPTRFYNIPLLSQLQTLVVLHLRDAIIAMLSLFGLIVFLKKSRRNELTDKTKTFYLFLVVLLSAFAVFMSFEFGTSFGSIEYGRFIAYARPLCVFLVGLALWQLDKFLHAHIKLAISNLIFAAFLFILVSSCFVQFYQYQPLVPRSNALSANLPENEYILNLPVVNTIFQTEMISFAETHSQSAIITSDKTTRRQINGFSDPSFFSRHTYFSPLVPNQNLRRWDLFLLHNNKAGALGESAEYRTREIIENLRLNAGNLIYDNGASFILSNYPQNYDPNQD